MNWAYPTMHAAVGPQQAKQVFRRACRLFSETEVKRAQIDEWKAELGDEGFEGIITRNRTLRGQREDQRAICHALNRSLSIQRVEQLAKLLGRRPKVLRKKVSKEVLRDRQR